MNSFFDIFLGVADGVGGWRSYGIDPGEFSSFLMRTCERLVESTNFNPKQPVSLLSYSYCELLEQKKPILGKFEPLTLIGTQNSTNMICCTLDRGSCFDRILRT